MKLMIAQRLILGFLILVLVIAIILRQLDEMKHNLKRTLHNIKNYSRSITSIN